MITNKLSLLTLCVGAVGTVGTTAAKVAEKPNIIILLADDLGYADVGMNGGHIETPNIDNIARQGVKLDNFYSCPVSSPTRAGTMTGRYPIRFGMMRSVVPPTFNYGINENEVLLPAMLKEAGYDNTAAFGKWHLGHFKKEWHPNNRGFDLYIGCYNGAADYFNRKREKQVDWHRNEEPLREEGYTTDLIGNHASEFIASVPKDESYFIYVPFTAPHSPYQAKESDIAKYKDLGKKAVYAAMVDCLDQNIGKILSAVEKRGDMDNTFILFYSDNGGTARGSNGAMRGHKFDTYEGGIRVCAACKWTGGGVSGGGVITERMGYIDVFPTLKALAYGDKADKIKDKNPLDGINVLPYIKGEKSSEDRIWYSYIDQRSSHIEQVGVNYGDWKFNLAQPAPDNNKPDKKAPAYELYKIDGKHANEKSEINDPEMKAKMHKLANDFLKNKRADQIHRKPDGDGNKMKIPVDWIIK